MCHSDLIHYLPFDYVVSSWSMENDFFRFLREKCRVSTAELERLLCRYHLLATGLQRQCPDGKGYVL